jgi:bifunctional DNase/RNase
MSNRVELEIVSIVPAHSHGAYTLVLGARSGPRKLPVLVGAFEAQAIAMELEGIKASRPLTHDLFVQAFEALSIDVLEVVITDLHEGIFFSKIICKSGSSTIELDSRTSDAIALAAKFHCPIFVMEKILDDAGYNTDDLEIENVESPGRVAHEELIPSSKTHKGFEQYSAEELEDLLEEAVRDEDYARAAKIRDEIQKRNK